MLTGGYEGRKNSAVNSIEKSHSLHPQNSFQLNLLNDNTQNYIKRRYQSQGCKNAVKFC